MKGYELKTSAWGLVREEASRRASMGEPADFAIPPEDFDKLEGEDEAELFDRVDATTWRAFGSFVTRRCCSSSHDPPDTACTGFERGAGYRCVYCDHEEKCHPGPGST